MSALTTTRIRSTAPLWIVAWLLALGLCSVEGQEKPERARPRPWKSFPDHIFFKDAFREALTGPRPEQLGKPTASPPLQPAGTAGSGYRWSQIISAETLEDEVKALQIALAAEITTPNAFSSGGHRAVRLQFTELAMLFAVIAEFDDEVRWKNEAPAVRDLFALAAANAKATSSQLFAQARERQLDLEELVRGGTLQASNSAVRKADWRSVCDRRPLMERLTLCYDEGLARWTANAAEFKAQSGRIRKETELLRLIATVLTKPGMEDAEDEDYQAHCEELGRSAEAVLGALERQDQRSARAATAEIGKSCSRCHEDYRA